MIEASFGGIQFCFIFFLFDRFQFKNHPFFGIDTTNSTGLDKPNMPHFLTRFWFASSPYPSELTSLRNKEDIAMNGRFEFREENMLINAILLTLISRKQSITQLYCLLYCFWYQMSKNRQRIHWFLSNTMIQEAVSSKSIQCYSY